MLSGSETAEMLAADYFEQNFSISIEVEDLSEAERIINRMNGYNLNANSWYNDYGGYSDIQRRVEAYAYTQAKETLRQMGTVQYEYEYVNKLADEIHDLEARYAAKQEEVRRLKELLGQSRTMEVLAAVERRLGWTETERDDLWGRLRQLYDIASRPYIHINLYQKAPEIEPLPDDTFAERLNDRFIRSVNGAIRFMENFVVWLSGALLPLVILTAFAVPLFLWLRRRTRIFNEEGRK
jgi:hypothetical protein